MMNQQRDNRMQKQQSYGQQQCAQQQYMQQQPHNYQDHRSHVPQPHLVKKPAEQKALVGALDYRSYLTDQLIANGDEKAVLQQPRQAVIGNSVVSTSTTSSQVDPKHGIVDYYLHFDSQNKDISSTSSNPGTLVFSLKDLGNNLGNVLNNIIEMEILGPLYLQKILTDDTLPDFYFMKKVYMIIKEFSTSQSVQSYNGKRYHFDFDVDDAGVAVRLTPLYPKIIFPTPVNLTSASLTFNFTVPMNFKDVPLNNDTLYIYPDASSNAAMYAASARLITTTPHNIHVKYGGRNQAILPTYGAGLALSSTPPNEWVACYVTDFISSDATVNTTMTSPTGHMITKLYSNTNIEIGGGTENNIDFSTPANLRLPYSPLTLVAGSPPLFSTVGSSFNYNHHLSVGDRVYFNSFASSDPDMNAAINSSTGWVVNFVDTAVTGTQFTVMNTSNTTLDLSSLINSVTNTFYMSPSYITTPPVINIAVRKTTFAMRFRTLKDTSTNYIFAV